MVRVPTKREKPNERVRWNEHNLRSFFLTLHTFPPNQMKKASAEIKFLLQVKKRIALKCVEYRENVIYPQRPLVT